MATLFKRSTANERAAIGLVQGIGYAIISLGVLYADVMFIALMQGALPAGLLAIAAYGGCLLTSGSIIALVIGKSHWFRPGGQIYVAWSFTVIESLVCLMNIIASVQVAKHGIASGPIGTWVNWGAPATPFVAVFGWMFLFYFDPSRRAKHQQMEMEDDMSIAQLEHQQNVHDARMTIKAQSLRYQQEYLMQHLQSPDFQEEISRGAREIVRASIAELTGKPVAALPYAPTPALPAGKNGRIIDSTAEKVETNPRQRAIQSKKQLPRKRKFTPTNPKLEKVTIGEQREVAKEQPNFSLPPARKPVKVQKRKQEYIVNKRQDIRTGLPVHD